MKGNNEKNSITGASARKVVASAIDNNFLILEEPDTGHKISWPLNKIPEPLDLGNELNLILECSCSFKVDPSKHALPAQSTDRQMRTDTELMQSTGGLSREDIMRKMLEELVN